MRHDYTVIFEPGGEGWIMATAPELPGTITQGRTMQEARTNIREAIALMLECYRDEAIKAAPASAVIETISLDTDDQEIQASLRQPVVTDDVDAEAAVA